MYGQIRKAGADILSVAVDLQGPDVARPYHDRAKAEFTTVVDETNLLAGMFGFKAVPNGMFVDEEGRLAFKHFSGFDIRKPETLEVVQMFLARAVGGAGSVAAAPQSRDGVHVASMDHFRRGLARLREGDRDGAVKIWREGIAAEPDNWLLRKQLWALENPEKFYDGSVDFAWQKVQIDAGR